MTKVKTTFLKFKFTPRLPGGKFISRMNVFNISRWKKIKENTGIQPQYARKITEIIKSGEINSMITLANHKGIGEKTLEKAFNYVLNSKINNQSQLKL